MKQKVKSIIKKMMQCCAYPLRKCIVHTVPQPSGSLEHIKKIQVRNDVILPQVQQMIQEGHSVTINVKGYSMRPILEHTRDKVILVPFEKLAVGDAVLARINAGSFVLHRIIAIKGTQLTLMGDGNLAGTEHCKTTDVAGKVKTYIRKGRPIQAHSPAMQCYTVCWRKCLPIRRYLLYIYRLLNNL